MSVEDHRYDSVHLKSIDGRRILVIGSTFIPLSRIVQVSLRRNNPTSNDEAEFVLVFELALDHTTQEVECHEKILIDQFVSKFAIYLPKEENGIQNLKT